MKTILDNQAKAAKAAAGTSAAIPAAVIEEARAALENLKAKVSSSDA